MAENKKSILIYIDWINIFEELSDEEAGVLIKHLFRYVNDQDPEPPNRLTKLLFEPIKQTLKRDLIKYEKKRSQNRDNIRKRWNKKDTTVYDRIRTDTNHTDSDSVIDSDIDIKEEKRLPIKKSADFIDEIINVFVEEHGSYSVIAIGKERKMAAKLLSKYKEFHPDANGQDVLDGLRTYFKQCINIEDPWLHDNMSIPTIVNQFNQINKILKNGKSTRKKGATANEIADAVAEVFAVNFTRNS